MNLNGFTGALFFLVLAVTSSSCGPSPQAGGGIGGTGSVATVSSGPVTKFGSVFVSGTEYDNTNTIYCIDRDPCSRENRLKLGMVVLVNGTRTEEYSSQQTLTRIADKITYEETVEGFVQSVAVDGLSFVVLGQVVSVNQKTEIDFFLQGDTPHSLNVDVVSGALVEVSGFVTGDGTILATYIAPYSGMPHFEVEGFVKNHDHGAKTFEIGSLVVDYALADTSAMPSPAIQTWNGLVVFAHGDQWSKNGTGANGARMTATSVMPRTLGILDIKDIEVEDFITHVAGPGDFFLNNVHVQTSSTTAYEGGAASDLVVGAHVEVEGSLIGGIVSAAKIEFEGETELQATVATINLSGNSLTLAGLDGLVIQFDSHTKLEGQGTPRRIDDLKLGDHLSIHGRLQGGHILLAEEVERTDPTSTTQLEGLLTSAADPLLVLMGVSIDTSAVPESGFLSRYGPIGRSAFFAGLVSGKKIVLKGAAVGSTVVWSSASRRDLP